MGRGTEIGIRWTDGRPVLSFLRWPVGLLVASLIADVIGLTSAGWGASDLPMMAVLEGALVVFVSLVQWMNLVTRVGVTEEGVTFVNGWGWRTQVRWQDLGPPRYPGKLGAVSFYQALWAQDSRARVAPESVEGGGRPGLRLNVTVVQARAILAADECPKWKLEPGVREGISGG